MPPDGLRLVGHKGADLISPGNTVESFAAAVKAGVDTIELDVLWTRDGHPRLPAAERSPLVVAHDWGDAERRTPLTLGEALDAFGSPPLDRVEVDLDIKLPGREEELVEALRERGLLARAMVSTMELSSLARIRRLEPDLRRGWTYPRVTQRLGLEALGEGSDAGGADVDAPQPSRARGARSAQAGSPRDVGLPPADHPPTWPESPRSRASS